MKSIKTYINEHIIKGHLNKDKQSNPNQREIKTINDIQKGDIFVTDYSYSSRHVYFWLVENIKGRSTVEVKSIRPKIVSGSYNGYGEVVPDMDNIKDEIVKGRFLNGRFKIEKRYAWLWNGNPEAVYSD